MPSTTPTRAEGATAKCAQFLQEEGERRAASGEDVAVVILPRSFLEAPYLSQAEPAE